MYMRLSIKQVQTQYPQAWDEWVRIEEDAGREPYEGYFTLEDGQLVALPDLGGALIWNENTEKWDFDDDDDDEDYQVQESVKLSTKQLRKLIKETIDDFYVTVVGDGGFINKRLKKPSKVKIVDLDVIGVNKNDPEVRVYFDTTTWDTKTSGLIYGDSKFLNDIKKKARELNPKIKDLDYSEHGMQGSDYVSFDAIFESTALQTEGKLDFTFEELYDRLVDTLFELEDRFGQDPERISRQACRTIERYKRDDVTQR